MKIKIIFIILFCLLAISIAFSQDTAVTKARLVKHIWANRELMRQPTPTSYQGDIAVGGGLCIEFLDNNSFNAIMGPRRAMKKKITSSYEIKNAKVTLFYNNNEWLKNGIIKIDGSDLKFSYYLQFENELNLAVDEILKAGFVLNTGNKMIDLDSPLAQGTKVKIDNIDAVIMGNKSAETTAAVNIRKKPAQDAEFVTYNDSMEEKPMRSFPADTIISVLARTVNKEKLNQWTNYWYYVEYEGYFSGMVRAWAFAEFIKIKE